MKEKISEYCDSSTLAYCNPSTLAYCNSSTLTTVLQSEYGTFVCIIIGTTKQLKVHSQKHLSDVPLCTNPFRLGH